MATVEHIVPNVLNRIPLGRRISELMAEKGDAFSIRNFAARIGINRETFRLMLLGSRRISPSELEMISGELGVPLERLKQLDTQHKEQELNRILSGRVRTEVVLMRAQELAQDLLKVSMGATERGICLNYLGKVRYFQKCYDDAHQVWLDALEYAKKLQKDFGDKYLLNLVTSNLMLTFIIRKEYSRIDDVISLVEEMFPDDQETLGMADYTRMRMQEDRGDLEQARQFAYLSLEHIENTNENRQIGHALINVAHYEYLLGNYETASRTLSTAIQKVQEFEDILVLAVKEYVKSLIQLNDHTKAIHVIDQYAPNAKGYPIYYGKLMIMYAHATGDPTFADAIINDSGMNVNVRNAASKFLQEYYYLKGDAGAAMRYYEKGRIFSRAKCEYLKEEDF